MYREGGLSVVRAPPRVMYSFDIGKYPYSVEVHASTLLAVIPDSGLSIDLLWTANNTLSTANIRVQVQSYTLASRFEVV